MYKKLLAALVSIATAQGTLAIPVLQREGKNAKFIYTIVNDTDYPVHVKLEYFSCKEDGYDIEPGQRIDDRAGVCKIQRISATSIKEPSLHGERTFYKKHHCHVVRTNEGHKGAEFHILEQKSEKNLTIIVSGENHALASAY
jgi:hypothetical protein